MMKKYEIKNNQEIINLDDSMYEVFQLKDKKGYVYSLNEAYFKQLLYNLLIVNNAYNTLNDLDLRINDDTLIIQANKKIDINNIDLIYYIKMLHQKQTLIYDLNKMDLNNEADIRTSIQLDFEMLLNNLHKFSFKNVVYDDIENKYHLKLEDFYVGKKVFEMMDKYMYTELNTQTLQTQKELYLDLVNIFYGYLLKRLRLTLTTKKNFIHLLNNYNDAYETLTKTAKKDIYSNDAFFIQKSFNANGGVFNSSLSILWNKIIDYAKANNVFNQNQNYTNNPFFKTQSVLLNLYGGFKFENEKVQNKENENKDLKNDQDLIQTIKQDTFYNDIIKLLEHFDFKEQTTKDELFAYNNALIFLWKTTIDQTLFTLSYKNIVNHNDALFDFSLMDEVKQMSMEEWFKHHLTSFTKKR